MNAQPDTRSRYVCRAHHHEAVTWRGRGCLECTIEDRERAARRAIERRRRQQPTADEWATA